MVVLLAILGWYISSSLLTASNKVLFDLLNIQIPLLVTFIHFAITCFVLVFIKWKFPSVIGTVQVSRADFVRWVVPVAACTAGDVGLSNMAYSRLPISVMTVLKSSAPVCIYTAGVLSGIERFQWRTSLVCLVIAVSIAVSVPDSPSEQNMPNGADYVGGIVMVAIAVVCLSIRWVFVQTLTRRYSPMQLVYLIQPTSAIVLLPFALIIDCDSSLGYMIENRSLLLPCLLIFGSAFAALALLLFEYKIVHATTSLTLSIAGIGKEVLTLSLSVILLSESVSLRQAIAISVSIVGIFTYAMMRRDTTPVSRQPSIVVTKEMVEYEIGETSPTRRSFAGRHTTE